MSDGPWDMDLTPLHIDTLPIFMGRPYNSGLLGLLGLLGIICHSLLYIYIYIYIL